METSKNKASGHLEFISGRRVGVWFPVRLTVNPQHNTASVSARLSDCEDIRPVSYVATLMSYVATLMSYVATLMSNVVAVVEKKLPIFVQL